MNWLKENPFLAGLIAVTVVVAGGLSYLLSQSMARYQESRDGYSQAVSALHALENRVPYPNQENLAKAKAAVEQYRQSVEKMRNDLAVMQFPLDRSVRPQQFQDDLRAAVNETVAKAQQTGVKLPQNFYLGFSQYANSLPSEQAAPYLARELAFIKQLVQQLILTKIASLDSLDRAPLAEEGAATPVPSQKGGRGPAAPVSQVVAPIFVRNTFDISFTAEQSKVRVALNSMLDAKQFLIVRSIELQNTNPAGPPVQQSTPVASGEGGSEGTAVATPTPKTLNVILGREMVKATARIELMNFTLAEGGSK